MAKHEEKTITRESAKARADRITKAANAAAEGSDSLFEMLDTMNRNSVKHTDSTIIKSDKK